MMEQSDRATLAEMQREIGPHSIEGRSQVAERLLQLRDKLKFDDTSWYHDLTQHVATLDSASTFHPANDTEKRQLNTAVQQAVAQITRLIAAKSD